MIASHLEERSRLACAAGCHTARSIRRLLRRCLSKDLRGRLHDIADARLEIRDAQTGDAETVTQSSWNRLAAVDARWRVRCSLSGPRRADRPIGDAQRAGSARVYRSVILPPTGRSKCSIGGEDRPVPRFARGLALTRDGETSGFCSARSRRTCRRVGPSIRCHRRAASRAAREGGDSAPSGRTTADSSPSLPIGSSNGSMRLVGPQYVVRRRPTSTRAVRGTATTSFSSLGDDAILRDFRRRWVGITGHRRRAPRA